jgi:hypothetical protein
MLQGRENEFDLMISTTKVLGQMSGVSRGCVRGMETANARHRRPESSWSR